MNLPTLIFVAVVLPFTIFVLLWLFGEAMHWFAPRPKTRGLLFVALGIAYLAIATWDVAAAGPQWALDSALRIAMGAGWVFLGAYEYRRGEAGTVD